MRKLLLAALAAAFIVGLSAAPAYAATTRLTIALNKRGVSYDSPALLSGVLKATSGAALSKRTVYLTRGGVRIRTLVTDSRGRISTLVKFNGLGIWRFDFPGATGYSRSSSAAVSTYPVYYLSKTYKGEFDGDTYTTTRDLRFAKGHTYQVVFDHPSWVFLGRGETDYMANYSGRLRSFTFTPPVTGYYWCEWDWGGSIGPGDSTLKVVVW